MANMKVWFLAWDRSQSPLIQRMYGSQVEAGVSGPFVVFVALDKAYNVP
jgi:hypothetical protein